MSLSISLPPPLIAGTRRPIIVQLATDTVIATAGSANNTISKLEQPAADGDTWLFNFNGHTVTFTAKDNPEHNGNEFPAGTTVALIVAGYLEDNYLLSLHYHISTPAGDDIQFIAKEPGTQFDLLHEGSTYAGFSQWQFIDGEDPFVLPNFQAWLDLYVEAQLGSTDYGNLPVATLSATADPKGRFTFDLSALLDAQVEDAQPDLSDAVPDAFSSKMLCRYRFTYNEAWGSPIEPRIVQQSAIYTALRGQKALDVEGLVGNVFSSKILSGRPRTKEVATAQPEFLYLLLSAGVGGTISFQIHYTDGSTGSLPDIAIVPSIAQVYSIPCGHDQLGIGALAPAKTVESYVFNFAYVDGDFTYTFRLVEDCPPRRRYLVFRNEMGGYDTLPCTGRLTRRGSFARDQAQKSLPANYELQIDRMAVDYHVRSQDEYGLHTGWFFTEEEVAYYARQFLQSENVLFHEEGRFTPVTLLTKEVTYSKDRVKLYGFAFRFRRSVAHGEKHGVYLK